MEFTAYDIAIVPVIVALVAVFGSLGLPKKLKPVLALVLGLAAGLFYIAPQDPKQAILIGVVIGLSAVGAYSGVKNTIEWEDDGLSDSERKLFK